MVIGILAFTRGTLELVLLIAAFTVWGAWLILKFLMPSWRRSRAERETEQRAQQMNGAAEGSNLDAATGQLLLHHVNYRISEYLAASRAPRLLDADGSRERLFCKDGFSISVQAGKEFYCAPHEDRADGVFETVELGLPSSVEEDILPYAESKKAPTKSVYPFVPVEVVEAVIRKHGGFFESRMQVVEAGASAEASD